MVEGPWFHQWTNPKPPMGTIQLFLLPLEIASVAQTAVLHSFESYPNAFPQSELAMDPPW